MAHIELKGIKKTFRGSQYISFYKTAQNLQVTYALDDINLRVEEGSRLCILGPSGCGNSTLLKVIGGLIDPDEGEVYFFNEDMSHTKPGERRIGMVFQDYALYPHMTGQENVLSHYLFKKNRRNYEQEAMEKFKRTSELMGVELKHLLARKPPTFSGGEKQRVAVGRCITRDLHLFLLDEPFSNLDQQLREQYRVKLKKLLNEFNVTTVFVTHDQHEASVIGDVIALMEKGRIVQVGTLSEIYNKPINLFAAQFLNPRQETSALNLVDGRMMGDDYEGLDCGFRSEDAVFSGSGKIKGTLFGTRILPFSENRVAEIDTECGHCNVIYSGDPGIKDGEPCAIDVRKFHVFNKKTGLRIDTVTA